MNPHRVNNRINKRQLREISRIATMASADNALFRNTFLDTRKDYEDLRNCSRMRGKDIEEPHQLASSLSYRDRKYPL